MRLYGDAAPDRRLFSPPFTTLDLVLVGLLLIMTGIILGKDISVGGLRWGDAAVHAMDGVLIHDWVAAGPEAWRHPVKFAEDQYGEDELLTEFRLPHDAMWLHTARVADQCRRHGLYKRLLQFAFSSLRGRGVSRILFSVERLNRPSVAAHESAGAIRIGSCLIIRLLGMTACLGSWTRRGWPRLSFGTRRSPCRLSVA
jgi:GNAT superfamily N-acetyltransferase